jgi:MinD-like ATPase involved in chromosome partitioning or flagellar assembly
MGPVLGVVGGSGGVGTSTFAGVLAASAGAAMLIDLDAAGGGLDVVLGIESVAGARWSGLRVEGGRLDPAVLLAGLPYLGACAVLAADGAPLDAVVVAAVLDAAADAPVDAVVLDLPRAAGAVRAVAVERCDLVVVLARSDVGGLVGAHVQLASLGDAPAGVVVRRGSVPPEDAAALVGAPLLGVLPPLGPASTAGPPRVPRSVGRLASGLVAGVAGPGIAGARRAAVPA